MDRQKAHTRVLIALITLGAIFLTVAVPPLQKPDEEAHFIRSIAITRGKAFCTAKGDRTIRLRSDIVSMIGDVKRLKLPNHAERKFDLSLYHVPIFSDGGGKMTSYTIDPVYCGFPTLPYIPLAAGIVAGELLHLNPYLVFLLGRGMMMALGLAWMAALYRNTPAGYKPALLCVFSFPMFLHQLGAYSYDGVHILLACTIFVIIVSGRPTHLLPWLGAVMAAFLLSKTGGYELIPLLYFILPTAQVVSEGRWYWRRTWHFFSILAIAVGVGKWMELKGMAAGATLNPGVDPLTQITYIASHPAGYLLMVAKTTYHFSLFYLQSMIGILGWLEYGFPHIIYFIYVAAAVYIVATARLPDHSLLSHKRMVILTGIVAGSYLYIITIFYILWNPVRATITDGVQGRYFLALLPFGLFALMQAKVRWIPYVKQPEIPSWVYTILFTTMAVVIMYSVAYRYYL